MITIIIFSSNRIQFLSELIADIKKCNKTIKNQVLIVSYNETKININEIKKKIKEPYFKYYIEKKNLTFSQKIKKYSKKVKTKYFWHLSDDDRLKYNSIKEINNLLNNNQDLSGITINYDNKIKIGKNILKNEKKKLRLVNFDLYKNSYRLGLMSTQIYKTKEFINFKQPNKFYFNDAYYHIGVILNLLSMKKTWKYIDKKMIIYRFGIIDYQNKFNYLKRLDDEFKGYFKPIKEYIKQDYSKIFKRIFFINIISWIFLNIKLNGKINTFKIILKNLKFFPLNLYLYLFLFTILVLPKNILNFLKKYRNLVK